jgi:ATP-dependent Clp protease ATP-binding subunit ClpA
MQYADELARLQSRGMPELTSENLAHIIELWTKIPAASIRADEYSRLSNLHLRLKEHLIGQDEAIDTVCAAIKRNRAGLQAKRKPSASYCRQHGRGEDGAGQAAGGRPVRLAGIARAAGYVGVHGEALGQPHHRLPAGYVGYDEAGQLTEKIRRKPYSVVLFDEIERPTRTC